MTIRARTDADLKACVAFLRTVHETAGYPVNWPAEPDAWLTPPDALGSWVATADDRVVGHVALTFSGPGVVLADQPNSSRLDRCGVACHAWRPGREGG
jgi:hypothetical protein